MNPLPLALTLTFIPLTATAQDGNLLLDQGRCEGTQFFMQEQSITAGEVAKMAPHLMPVPDGAFLMRFESDTLGGDPFLHWSNDHSGFMQDGYCSEVFYRQRFPQEGIWAFELENTNLTGCPAMLDPTRGLASEVAMKWGFRGPRKILDSFPFPFAMTKIDPLHWIATADAMPNIPGDVNITYEFVAVSPTQVDVTGTLDLNIAMNGVEVHCTGDLEMVGHPKQ